MRKVITVTFIACTLAVLSILSTPSALASGPTPVSGTVTYYPYVISSRVAGDNTIAVGAETADWYGSLQGTSFDTWIVVMHPAGFWSIPGGVHVSFTGTSDGVSGTLQILLIGKGQIDSAGVPHWTGNWVVLSGTDGLANMHGQGVWSGVGTSLVYSGIMQSE